ncbi:hypothetical protein AOLI_G00264900, partial [Acnodon oligacanthus]
MHTVTLAICGKPAIFVHGRLVSKTYFEQAPALNMTVSGTWRISCLTSLIRDFASPIFYFVLEASQNQIFSTSSRKC